MSRWRPIQAGILLLLAVTAAAQQGTLKFSGQAWGSGAYGNDPLDNFGNAEGTAGYIPELNLKAGQPGGAQLEALLAFRASYLYRQQISHARPDASGSERLYRGWFQLRGARWDMRLGRQKIAFGPGQFLRPLAWFDTLDLRDPTGQTAGVNAVRARYFPNDDLSIWVWGIMRRRGSFGYNLGDFSPGGRAEYILGNVDLGLTFHQTNYSASAGHRRWMALDFRTDKVIGLWAEAMIERTRYAVGLSGIRDGEKLMIGADYTLPIGNGVLVMVEHLQSRTDYFGGDPTIITQATALVGALPMGMFDRLTVVAYFLHDANFSSYFFMWQRTYDRFSVSTLVFANPTRADFGQLGDLLPSVVGVGTSIQVLLVFHH